MTEENKVNLEGNVFSYTRQEDKLITFYQLGKQKIAQEIIYSKHNCEVLNRRIEIGLLKRQKQVMKEYKRMKKINSIYLLTIVFLDFLFMGNASMTLMIAMNIYMLSNVIDSLTGLKKEQAAIEQSLVCIEVLKKESIVLKEEEIRLLTLEERAVYEKSGELTISNMNEVCNQKILNKHFGKKNG